jgi:hypothetical protein
MRNPFERGWLLSKAIPRSKVGDPNFKTLEEVRAVFSDAELVHLVNQYVYTQDYQRTYHKQRSKAERDRLRPIKRKVHELFGVSYLTATEAQIRKAVAAVKEDIANATKNET